MKAATTRIKAKYDRISPYYNLMMWFLERTVISRWRRKIFDSLGGGTTLEVGVGTGKNLDFYPPAGKMTAIDISSGMLKRTRRRASRKGVKVALLQMDIEELSFRDQSLDTVLATFVFCSVPEPIKGLGEIKRVCKKNGRIILLEHVRPGSMLLGKIFDLFNPIMVWLMGVNINRDTVSNMTKAGLKIVEDKDLLADIVKLVIATP
jgi:ubiquinone/menaquinone biosynthesis C-methylase UbiE